MVYMHAVTTFSYIVLNWAGTPPQGAPDDVVISAGRAGGGKGRNTLFSLKKYKSLPSDNRKRVLRVNRTNRLCNHYSDLYQTNVAFARNTNGKPV